MRLGFKKGILTYLGAIFLMSYIICNNVGAVSPVIDLNNYETVNFYPYFNINCRFLDGSGNQVSFPQNVNYCTSPDNMPTTTLNRIYSYNTYSVQKDDILEFYLLVFSPVTFSHLQSFTPGVISTGSNLYYLMDLEQVADNVYDNVSFQILNGSGDATYTRAYYSVYKFTFKVLSGGNWNIGFILPDNYFVFSAEQLTFSLYNLSIYRKTDSDPANAEQEQKTKEAAEESEDVAEDNSESQQTDSIINVFGSFVSAVSSLQPTNCNVTLQWPSALGGNMTVNVCQNKDKAGNIISVFGSITLIVFYIPLALKLLSMIYNEIRSFTSG